MSDLAWHEGPMLSLDLETTSKNPEEARIVTASLILVDASKRAIDEQSWLSDVDGEEIPEEATAVHGITTQRAREEGRHAGVVVREICRRLAEDQDRPLVVFRAPYDLTVLDREAQRHGLPPLAFGPVVDPLVLDRHLDRYRPGSRTLKASCAHYEVRLDGAHTASADALAAARLAWKIGKHGQIIRRAWNRSMEAERDALIAYWESVRGDLAKLYEAQKVWARDQALGLAQHFESQGEPRHVSLDWPIIGERVRVRDGVRGYDPVKVRALERELGIEL